MAAHPARGLKHFIDDIKSSKDKAAESGRVTLELAKIRGRFGRAQSGAKSLSARDLRKYACKLAYIRVLGYEVDFGVDEALLLASSPVAGDKAVGYVLADLVGDAASEADALALFTTVRSDLEAPARAPSAASHERAALALSSVANGALDVGAYFMPYAPAFAAAARRIAADRKSVV